MKTLVDYLREDGHEPRKEGSRWMVLCPFHNEKTPSFSIFNLEKGDGGGFKCFGCGVKGDSVTYLEKARKLTKKAALRLHKEPPSGERQRSGDRSRSAEHKAGAKPKQPPFVTELPRDALGIWDYVDADGKLKFKVVKRPPGRDGKKHIRPYTRGKKGSKRGWIIKNFMESDRPLYRLPQILKAKPDQQVMVVEGEKWRRCGPRRPPPGRRHNLVTWHGLMAAHGFLPPLRPRGLAGRRCRRLRAQSDGRDRGAPGAERVLAARGVPARRHRRRHRRRDRAGRRPRCRQVAPEMGAGLRACPGR